MMMTPTAMMTLIRKSEMVNSDNILMNRDNILVEFQTNLRRMDKESFDRKKPNGRRTQKSAPKRTEGDRV